jgi:hypothetical protein
LIQVKNSPFLLSFLCIKFLNIDAMQIKRNLFFTALLLILVSTTTFAQVNYGLRAGAAVTSFANRGDITDNLNVTFSPIAGAFLDLPISKSFFIQPEVNYLRKGRSDETSELNTSAKTNFMIHYLQVPVLFQYRDHHLMDKQKYVFYINAGPYAGFSLDNQMKPTNNIILAESNKTDWGATFGIGFQKPFYTKNLRFDLRYDMGISEIANQPSDYRTKALSLTIGLVL